MTTHERAGGGPAVVPGPGHFLRGPVLRPAPGARRWSRPVLSRSRGPISESLATLITGRPVSPVCRALHRWRLVTAKPSGSL